MKKSSDSNENIQKDAFGGGRHIIFMFYPNNSSIESDEVLDLIEQLNQIKSSKEQTSIDLVLNSQGGDVYAAYKMLKVLRSKCSFLRVIVPLAAKSAATLLSLGANEIIMGPQSELGPLDAPIEHPLVEGIRLSALDGVRPIEFFSDFITRISFQTGMRLRNEVGLGRKDCLEIALTHANQFCSPIVSKLDPLVVNMCYRSLTLAEKYGNELLLNYMLKENPDKDLLATAIVNNLVWEYPEHGFVIDIDEAKRLNLVVRSSDEYDDWHNAWTLFLEYKNYNKKIISFVENKDASPDRTKKFKRKKEADPEILISGDGD